MKRSSEQVWDEYLVLNAQLGNQNALRRLIQRHQGPLLAYIQRLLGNEADAQDVLQNSLMSCCRHLSRLRDPARFRAWLYRVATNQCRDWQRQAYRQRERQVALDQVLPTLSAKVRSEEDDVRAILERLPQDDRSILALFYLEGFSVKELAFTLELSLSAVKTRLYRARGRFDELWRAEEP